MKPAFSNLEEDDPLQIQFKTLQLEWDSIKHSISRSNRRTSADHNIIHPYSDSPKQLISSLQNECSPNLELGFGFDDGLLTGRRLFEESEVGSDDNINNNINNVVDGVCFEVDEKSDVGTEVLVNGVCFDDEKSEVSTEIMLKDLPRCDVVASGGRGYVGRWFVSVVMVLLALVIVAFESRSEDNVILVPT